MKTVSEIIEKINHTIKNHENAILNYDQRSDAVPMTRAVLFQLYALRDFILEIGK
jgi:hypothetical protein